MNPMNLDFFMRRASASFFLGIFEGEKSFHSGSYELRVPCFSFSKRVCARVIRLCFRPRLSAAFNAHITNARFDGFCPRTHINEAFSC